MDANQASIHPLSISRRQGTRWILVGLVLLAWGLRLPPALENRFHPDEALYGYWGLLIAHGWDPWLAGVPVYKPPLLPYLLAGVHALSGGGELAVRLPGLAAGLSLVPLAAALAASLYRSRWAAWVAAACVALSPFAILFSATAFTDLPMVAFGLGACVAAARGRSGWAGVLTGLAFASKQTGVVWLPLAVLLCLQAPGMQTVRRGPEVPDRRVQRSWGVRVFESLQTCGLARLLLACALVIAVTFAWDAVRVAQGAQGFWQLGVGGYGGLRLIWPQELWGRLHGWAEQARYLFVSPLVNGALLGGLPALVWVAVGRRRPTRTALADLTLVSFVLVYSLLHWLWAFPIWDRYLLPLVPVLAVLLGRIVVLVASGVSRLLGRVRRCPSAPNHHWPLVTCTLLLAVSLVLPAWRASRFSHYPVGGDHGAYDGIRRIAEFMREQPEGTVLYQHWLGWPYAYYLFDVPVYVAHWPTPAWLAEDVSVFGRGDARYIAFPPWESSARVERTLAQVGYGLDPVLTTTRRDGAPSFVVHRIQPLVDP